MPNPLFMSVIDAVRFVSGFSAKFASVDKYNWSYIEISGKDEQGTDVVMFLHGFSSMKESWVRVARGIERRYKIVIPDLPGHGRTTPVDALANYSMPSQAQRLHEFLQKEVPADKKIHLVGCSMGGMLAEVYAGLFPDQVKTLTLICPADVHEMNQALSFKPVRIPNALALIIAEERKKQLPVLEKIVSDALQNPLALEELLSNIRAKTLVIWGKHDRVLHASSAEVLQEKLHPEAQGQTILFDNCGHIVQHEKHAECTAAINSSWLTLGCSGAKAKIQRKAQTARDFCQQDHPELPQIERTECFERDFVHCAVRLHNSCDTRGALTHCERRALKHLPPSSHTLMMASLLMSVFDVVRFISGFSAKNTSIDQYNWSYIERPGKNEKDTDVVVFLHGFSSVKESWVRVARGVDKRYKIVIPDLPGQGRTTPIDAMTNYSMPSQAERLHEFLEKEVPADKTIHLVGCSMGGMLAGVYAGLYPKRIKSLTMVCPAGISMPRKSTLLKVLEDSGRNLLLAHTADDLDEMNKHLSYEPHKIPRVFLNIFASEREKQLPVLEKIVGDSLQNPTVLEDLLPSIRAKTLVMWGKHDQVLDVSSVDVLKKKLTPETQGQVLLFDDCGHILQHEKHAECTAAINKFLAGEALSVKHLM